jgi:histone H3/H4
MSSNVVTPQKQKEQQVRKKIHHLTVGASAKIVSEIVRLQSAIPAEDVDSQNDRLMIPKAAFIRLVREVSQDVCQDLGITRPVFWAGEALGMLHLIAEAHLVDGFLTADVLRAHRAQATLMPDDMKLATFITSHGTTEPPELTKEIKRLQRYVAERNSSSHVYYTRIPVLDMDTIITMQQYMILYTCFRVFIMAEHELGENVIASTDPFPPPICNHTIIVLVVHHVLWFDRKP